VRAHTGATFLIWSSARRSVESVAVVAPSARVRLPGLPRRKVIRIATGCADVEQFVATFCRLCEDDACFVPTTSMRPPGIEAVFALQLTDGTPLLRGVGVVMAAWRDADNPFGRPGMFLGFRRLTADSRALVFRMLGRREAARRGHADTIPHPSSLAVGTQPPAAADGIVAAVHTARELTERCEPAFADCAVDEPPRSAIATILGVAPLTRPNPVPMVALPTREPEPEPLAAVPRPQTAQMAAQTERTPVRTQAQTPTTRLHPLALPIVPLPTVPLPAIARSAAAANDPTDPAWPPDVRRLARGTDPQPEPPPRVSRPRYAPRAGAAAATPVWLVAAIAFVLAFALGLLVR
jgi:hypothetical protein